jgi:cell division protein FtsW
MPKKNSFRVDDRSVDEGRKKRQKKAAAEERKRRRREEAASKKAGRRAARAEKKNRKEEDIYRREMEHVSSSGRKRKDAASKTVKTRPSEGGGLRKAGAKGKKVRRKKVRLNTEYISESAMSILTDYDYWIVLLVTILTVFGVIMVFSAGYYNTMNMKDPDPYYFLKRQGFFAIVGFVLMYIFAKIDYHVYAKWAKPIILISIVLLALLFTPLGVTVNFATRWISIGPMRITPSELSKLAVIIFTSAVLAEDPSRIRQPKYIAILFGVMFIHAGMIIKQPNLSTAIVICMIMLGIMFVAGLRLWYYGAMIGAGALGTFYILNFKKNTHWYSRLTNWKNPFADAQGEGYQVSQSLIALGNGGLKGLGLGNSITKNLYLPEPQNDFILAIIGEETGFIGILLLMFVYIILIYRCFLVSAGAKDKLGLFLASGITIMLALQVIINVAVVTASMPATGITLPFISYGGTSLWVFMAAMGILLNISKKER